MAKEPVTEYALVCRECSNSCGNVWGTFDSYEQAKTTLLSLFPKAVLTKGAGGRDHDSWDPNIPIDDEDEDGINFLIIPFKKNKFMNLSLNGCADCASIVPGLIRESKKANKKSKKKKVSK